MKKTEHNGRIYYVGVPESKSANNNGGRLIVGENYKIVGFVPQTSKINGEDRDWDGVEVVRLATGAPIVMGLNTLLGVAIRLEKGEEENTYVVERLDKHCFQNAEDFSARLDDEGKFKENGTVFAVKAVKPLKVNKTFKPASIDKKDAAPEHFETKMRDFYLCGIVEKVAE